MAHASGLARLFVWLGLTCASTLHADAPLIFCIGHGCGGDEGHRFAYEVDAASYPMVEFKIGTSDPDPAQYKNVTVPPGWQFAVEPVGMIHACGGFAPHGEVSIGPCYSLTLGQVRWWTDDPANAVEFFTFAFDHPWPPEDVGFELKTVRSDPPYSYWFYPDWQDPVGFGTGPVHGPWDPDNYCWSNQDCGDDSYCYFVDCAIETGYCVPRPTGCPDVWDPVCGCDGVTYGNACEAAMAGQSIDHEGACDCPEDLNGDAFVDLQDLGILLAWFGLGPGGDIDGDGDTDLADLGALLAVYGQPCD
jgi:hypothetical protein